MLVRSTAAGVNAAMTVQKFLLVPVFNIDLSDRRRVPAVRKSSLPSAVPALMTSCSKLPHDPCRSLRPAPAIRGKISPLFERNWPACACGACGSIVPARRWWRRRQPAKRGLNIARWTRKKKSMPRSDPRPLIFPGSFNLCGCCG